MNQGIAIALLITGLGLLLYGIAAAISTGPDFNGTFLGSPPDKTNWPLIGGLVAGVLGGWLLIGSRRP